MCEAAHEPLAPAVIEPGEAAIHLPERLPALGGSLGIDQIGHRLGLGQVEAAVIEGLAREITRAGRPQLRKLGQGPQRRRANRAAAMEMEFRHILAGLAFGAGKPEHERIVDPFALV